jgi:kumamolisin
VRLSILLKAVPRGEGPGADRRRYIEQQRRRLEKLRPRDREYLTPDSFAEAFELHHETLDRLRAFVREYGLGIEDTGIMPALRHVVVSGLIANVERAFQVKLEWHTVSGQKYLWHEGPAYIPDDLTDVVEAVIGLYSPALETHSAPGRSGPPPAGVDPRTIACAYDFPPGDAKGESIAVILLGGGYDPADLNAYFAALNLKVPKTTLVLVGAQTNSPAPASSISDMLSGNPPNLQTLWTIEAALDLELIGTLANDAHIVVYLAENTTQGKLEALARATSNPDVSVISCSFGSFEDSVTQATLEATDEACETAGLFGKTVCVSSGDKGDGSGGSRSPRVRFMASSPNVLACGGTHATIPANGPLDETVWNELFFGNQFSSGGGVSAAFPLPSWQAGADVPGKTGGRTGRGVPDVAAKADMLTGYPIRVRGFSFNMGGTSAAAPLWASLVARLNQNLGFRVGHLTPLLYTAAFAATFRDVTVGDSGPHFAAHPSWDACTGLGTPNGNALLKLL